MEVPVHVRKHLLLYSCTHVLIHDISYVLVHMYLYICTYVHIDLYICTNVLTYTYHIYSHTQHILIYT